MMRLALQKRPYAAVAWGQVLRQDSFCNLCLYTCVLMGRKANNAASVLGFQQMRAPRSCESAALKASCFH
jgi:hypothetical protein